MFFRISPITQRESFSAHPFPLPLTPSFDVNLPFFGLGHILTNQSYLRRDRNLSARILCNNPKKKRRAPRERTRSRKNRQTSFSSPFTTKNKLQNTANTAQSPQRETTNLSRRKIIPINNHHHVLSFFLAHHRKEKHKHKKNNLKELSKRLKFVLRRNRNTDFFNSLLSDSIPRNIQQFPRTKVCCFFSPNLKRERGIEKSREIVGFHGYYIFKYVHCQ